MQLPVRPSTSKHFHRNLLYQPLDFLQVRAPLFPIEAYLDLAHGDTNGRGLHPQNPLVQKALAVGSLALLEELERESSSPKDISRRERKLLRYLIRMATRPTPYGLFSGVALAYWGEQTHLLLANAPRPTHTRPDMSWLLNLVWALEALPEVRVSTLHGKYRYLYP